MTRNGFFLPLVLLTILVIVSVGLIVYSLSTRNDLVNQTILETTKKENVTKANSLGTKIIFYEDGKAFISNIDGSEEKELEVAHKLISPDGNKYVIENDENSTIMTSSGQKKETKYFGSDFIWSSDSRYLAIKLGFSPGENEIDSPKNKYELWDLVSLSVVGEIELELDSEIIGWLKNATPLVMRHKGTLDVSGEFFEYDYKENKKISLFNVPSIDASNSYPKLSPDGTKLAFSGRYNLWIYDFLENKLEQLTNYEDYPKGEAVSHIFWSPDGRQLAFATFGGSLLRADKIVIINLVDNSISSIDTSILNGLFDYSEKNNTSIYFACEGWDSTNSEIFAKTEMVVKDGSGNILEGKRLDQHWIINLESKRAKELSRFYKSQTIIPTYRNN